MQKYMNTMMERFAQLTGCKIEPDSDLGLRFAVLAEELAKLENRLDDTKRDSLPQTAIGKALDSHVAQRGLVRKSAAKASGKLKFTRNTSATEDILLQKGIICATVGEPVCRYTTTADGLIKSGASYVEIAAEAVEGGSDLNTQPGTITAMLSAVGGVSAVSNTAAFTGGTDAEDDEALRKRLLDSYFSVANGTNSAFYRKEALGCEGVSSVKILPKKRGGGTVDIILGGEGATAAQSVANSLKAKLTQMKEINVDIAVAPAAELVQDIDVRVKLAENSSSAAETAEITQTIKNLLKKQTVGAPLNRALLVKTVMENSSVENCTLVKPAADVSASDVQLIVAGAVTVAVGV